MNLPLCGLKETDHKTKKKNELTLEFSLQILFSLKQISHISTI